MAYQECQRGISRIAGEDRKNTMNYLSPISNEKGYSENKSQPGEFAGNLVQENSGSGNKLFEKQEKNMESEQNTQLEIAIRSITSPEEFKQNLEEPRVKRELNYSSWSIPKRFKKNSKTDVSGETKTATRNLERIMKKEITNEGESCTEDEIETESVLHPENQLKLENSEVFDNSEGKSLDVPSSQKADFQSQSSIDNGSKIKKTCDSFRRKARKNQRRGYNPTPLTSRWYGSRILRIPLPNLNRPPEPVCGLKPRISDNLDVETQFLTSDYVQEAVEMMESGNNNQPIEETGYSLNIIESDSAQFIEETGNTDTVESNSEPIKDMNWNALEFDIELFD